MSSPLATALIPGAPAAPLPFLLAGAGVAPATPTPSCCPGPGGPSAVWHAPWRGRTRSVCTPPRRGGGTPCPVSGAPYTPGGPAAWRGCAGLLPTAPAQSVPTAGDALGPPVAPPSCRPTLRGAGGLAPTRAIEPSRPPPTHLITAPPDPSMHGVLCCALLRCALLCCAVLCCAVICCAVLCCAVLCSAVLCCAVLSCAVLCCAVLCCAVLCCAVLCFGMARCGAVWCGVVWCGVVWCGVVWCGVVWCDVVCSAVLCYAVLCSAIQPLCPQQSAPATPSVTCNSLRTPETNHSLPLHLHFCFIPHNQTCTFHFP